MRHAQRWHVSTHAAEPKARPLSKMWLYLATEQHCCTLLKSNFKGCNRLDKWRLPVARSSDDNYAVSWSTEYTLDYLFILQVFILTGERAREVGGEWQRRAMERHWQRRRERERLCVKWSLQVVFETDLPRGAANVFSVYMSVHAIVSDCVSVPLFHWSVLLATWHDPQSSPSLIT